MTTEREREREREREIYHIRVLLCRFLKLLAFFLLLLPLILFMQLLS